MKIILNVKKMEFELMSVLEGDDVERLQDLVGEAKEEDMFTANGSILHWAAENNAVASLSFLLAKENVKERVDFVDEQQKASALHWACT